MKKIILLAVCIFCIVSCSHFFCSKTNEELVVDILNNSTKIAKSIKIKVNMLKPKHVDFVINDKNYKINSEYNLKKALITDVEAKTLSLDADVNNKNVTIFTITCGSKGTGRNGFIFEALDFAKKFER